MYIYLQSFSRVPSSNSQSTLSPVTYSDYMADYTLAWKYQRDNPLCVTVFCTTHFNKFRYNVIYWFERTTRHNCERIITISLSSFNVSSRTYFYYSMHHNCINYQIFVNLSKSNENLASKILQVSTQKCSKGRGNNNEKIVEEKKGGKSNYPTQNALSLLDRLPDSLTSDSQTRIFSRTNFKVIGCRGKNKYWETSWTSNLLLVSLVKFSIYSALSPPPLTHKFIQTKHIFPWQDIAANQTLLLESLIPSN